MTNIQYNEAYYKEIEKLTPFMQGIYRAVRSEGFNKPTAKQMIETALKCGMINESFGEGIDKDLKIEQIK